MGVFDPLGEFAVVEVEAGIVARVGAIAKAAIDAVGARVDRGAQAAGVPAGQTSSR